MSSTTGSDNGGLAASRRGPRGQPRGPYPPSARLAQPRLLRRGGARQGARARLRHLPRLPPLLQSVQLLSDTVRCRRCHRRPARSTAVDKKVFWQVVDHCYLCDMCFMTKCPYVPPHPWNVDFPHLMLRAKAVRAARRASASATARWPRPTLSASIAGIPGGRRDRQRRQSLECRPRGCSRRRLASHRTRPCRSITPARRASACAHLGAERRRQARSGRLARDDAAKSRSSLPATATAMSRRWTRIWSPCSSTTTSR